MKKTSTCLEKWRLAITLTLILLAGMQQVCCKQPSHNRVADFKIAVERLDLDSAKRSLLGASQLELTECLMFASEQGKAEYVVLAVRLGADVNSLYMGEVSALLAACAGNKPGNIRQLVQLGCDINHGMKDGIWPVGYCAMNGKKECLSALIECGAEISGIGQKDGVSALMLACQHGQINCVRILLSNGANPNEADKSGRSAMDHLALESRTDLLSPDGEIAATEVTRLSDEQINSITALLRDHEKADEPTRQTNSDGRANLPKK